MSYMKWIVGVLLLCNAVMFLWATGHRPASTEFIRPPVAGETMMLLSELTPVQPSPEVADQTGGQQPAPPPPMCLRIGPFNNELLAEQTASRLRTLALKVESRTVNQREIRAYRVYLGPFDTQSAIDAQRQLLDNSGVKDHYVKRASGEKDIISLGLFSQGTGAEALINELGTKNIVAQTRHEDRMLEPTFWLELQDPEANEKNRAELTAVRNWGEESTKLSEYPCT